MKCDLLCTIRRFSCKHVGVVGFRRRSILRPYSRKLRRHILLSLPSPSWGAPWRWPWIWCPWHYRICWWCGVASTATVCTPTVLRILTLSCCLGMNVYGTKWQWQYLCNRGPSTIWYMINYLEEKNFLFIEAKTCQEGGQILHILHCLNPIPSPGQYNQTKGFLFAHSIDHNPE